MISCNLSFITSFKHLKINIEKMIKYYFIFVLLLFTGPVYAQDEIDTTREFVQFFYADGNLASEGYIENNKPNGYWKNYHQNGKLKSEGNRTFFQLDGLWIFYDQDGDTLELINYRKDMKNGYHILYEYTNKDSNTKYRTLVYKELYFNDKKELVSEYYKNGFLFREVYYTNGLRNGISKEYNEDGQLVTILNYRNNILINSEEINRLNGEGKKHGVWKTFHMNNQLKSESYYENGLLEGLYKEFDNRGQLLRHLRYSQGVLVSEKMEIQEVVKFQKEFYPNGKLQKAGSFMDTIPVGIHRFYKEDGIIELAKEYDETGFRIAEGLLDESGKKTGSWTEFYPDGTIKAKGSYKEGKKSGEWIFYFMDEKIEQRGFYSNDRLHGKWTWYYDTGEIWRSEEYFRGKENGESIEYLKDGNIIDQGEYIDGFREGKWMHQVGDHIEHGEYINGLKEGKWKYYYTNGKLKFQGSFIQGQEDGKQVWYYDTGKTEWEKFYIYGSKERTWRKFNEDGTLYQSITYVNDTETRINGKLIKTKDD